jgi:hypothetical protein
VSLHCRCRPIAGVGPMRQCTDTSVGRRFRSRVLQASWRELRHSLEISWRFPVDLEWNREPRAGLRREEGLAAMATGPPGYAGSSATLRQGRTCRFRQPASPSRRSRNCGSS